MTLTKEDKQWFALSIVCGIIVVVLFYMIWYKQATVKYTSLVKDRDALEAEVKKMNDFLGPESQAHVEDLKAKVAQFEQQLPNEKEIPKLLSFLREAADASDLRYSSIVSQPLIPSAFYIEVPFNIVVEGKYHGVGQMFNKIENNPRLMKLDAVDATASKEPPFAQTFAFKLSTYIFNPNPQPTTGVSTTAVPKK